LPSPAPVRDGFRAIWRQPSIFLAELAWRWSWGGAALLLVGLASRLSAIPLIVSMIVALITAKAEDIHGLSDLLGTVELTYIALMVWIAIAGPGRYSVDRFIVGLRSRDHD